MFRLKTLFNELVCRLRRTRASKDFRFSSARILIPLVLFSLFVESSSGLAVVSRVERPVESSASVSGSESLSDGVIGSNIVTVCSRTNVGRTQDIDLDSPHWTNITPPDAGLIVDCVLDPWRSGERMWLASSKGIWRGDDLNTDTPTWTLFISSSEIEAATDGYVGGVLERIIASASVPGTVFALLSHGGLGDVPNTWLGRSVDDGASWTWTLVANEGEQARDFGFAISSNANSPDDITVWASTNRGRLYRSADGGKSFYQILSLPTSGFYQLHAIYSPIAGNDDSILYVGGGSGSGDSAYIYRTLDGGDTWEDVSPVGDDLYPRGALGKYEIAGPSWSSTHL
ncbi:MAG TPA: hypothetical protein VI451_22370, partial [Anaerolineales bacterium]|nr:hypothetical protein [Anaerolineales bacterium]